MTRSRHHPVALLNRRILRLDGMSLTSRYPVLRRHERPAGCSACKGHKSKSALP